jgi:hypothetical protein
MNRWLLMGILAVLCIPFVHLLAIDAIETMVVVDYQATVELNDGVELQSDPYWVLYQMYKEPDGGEPIWEDYYNSELTYNEEGELILHQVLGPFQKEMFLSLSSNDAGDRYVVASHKSLRALPRARVSEEPVANSTPTLRMAQAASFKDTTGDTAWIIRSTLVKSQEKLSRIEIELSQMTNRMSNISQQLKKVEAILTEEMH